MNTSTRNSTRVFDATTGSFEQDVIVKSREVPVLVDFWATWCGPCKSLGPILEKLVDAYDGGLLLARVDVDREQELASYFQIRSVPTVMLVKDAQVVGGFPGALPESEVRRFLEEHGVVPRTGGDEEARDEGADPAADLEQLRAAVAADPDKAELKLELALTLVSAGEYVEAGQIIEALPANLGLDTRAVRAMSRVRLEQTAADAPPRPDLEQQVEADGNDLAARHQLGVRLVLDGESERGLEQLLELLRRDRTHSDGLPRQALVDAFNVIEDEALVRACRRRMSALLY